jgi:hypothetical protein
MKHHPPKHHPKRPNMTTFVLIDESTVTAPENGGKLTPTVLEQIAAACELQLNQHVCEEWGGNAIVRVGAAAAAGEVPAYILDDLPNAPGAAAYHDRNKGVPIVFAARTAFTGFTTGEEPLSEGLSHEFCETVGDPSAAIWVDRADGTSEAFELCDRLQGTRYDINGVVMANFLHKAAFFDEAAGPYDHMSVLRGQTDKTVGGYVILRQWGTGEHNAEKLGFMQHPHHHVWAEGVIQPQHRVRKAHFTSRSFRRGLRL